MTKFLCTLFLSIFLLSSINSQIEWYPYQDSIGKWSFRSVDGEHLNGAHFDTITNFYSGRANVKKNGKWSIINTEGKNITPFSFDTIKIINDDRSIVKKNGKWGVINGEGTNVIPASYEHIKNMTVNGKSFFKASRKNEEDNLENAIFNSNGRKIVPFDDHSITLRKDQYGYSGYSKQFKHILGLPVFNCETGSRKNTVIYSINGEVLLKPDDLNVEPPRYFFINNKGIVKSFPKYNYKHVSKYSIGYDRSFWARRLIISWEKEHMMLDYSGHVIVPLGKYKIEEYYKDTLYFAFQDSTSKWGLIDKYGKIALEPQFNKRLDNYPEFNVKIGYDSINSVIFDSSLNSKSYPYEEIIPISRKMNENIYRVKKDGRWGVLHGTKEIIQPQWGGVIINENLGLFICAKEGEISVFNLQGELILNSDMISVKYDKQWFLVVEKKRKYQYYDLRYKDPTEHMRKVKKAKLHKDWNSSLIPKLVSKEPYIVRIYKRRKGFMFIDSLGDPMMSNYANCRYTEPAIFNRELIGFRCLEPGFDFEQSYENAEQNIEYKQSFHLLNGVTLDDNYHTVSFVPENEYIIAHKESNIGIYSVQGEKLMSFDLDNKLDIFDSRFFYELAKKEFEYIQRVKEIFKKRSLSMYKSDGYYIMENAKGKKIIINIDKEEISPWYDTIKFKPELIICTYSKSNDIYNGKGKLLYSNVKNLNRFSGCYSFDKDGFNYWITTSGQLYMQKEI